MIYTTLKANKEHGINDCQIQVYCQEGITEIGYAFGEEYIDDNYCTDFDKLEADFTDRQIANGVLKYLRKLAKDKEEPLIIWNKMFIELDCGGIIAFKQLEELLETGVITKRSQLNEIEKLASKKGFTIKSDEYCYNQEEHWYRSDSIDDLKDKYFPCYAELNDCDCNNCCNCD